MNKQTTTGSAGFGWIRSLLEFRHHNPVARFVSTLLVIAMASLLVAGTGAAYATDGSGTDPVPSDTTPAADPTTDTSATQSTTTGSTTTGSTTTGTTTTTDPSTSTTPKTSAKTSNTVTTSSALSIVPNLQALATPLANTGDFEIDGDTPVDAGGSFDWDNRGDVKVDTNHDGSATVGGTGFGDTSGYQGSSKEGNYPTTWAGFFGAQGQADIGKLYDWSQTYQDPLKGTAGHATSPIDGHQLAYFAFTRDATEGTMMYDVEYNRLPNSTDEPARPDRSVGDVMFQFEQQGSTTILLRNAFTWVEEGAQGWSTSGAGACTEIDNLGFGWCPLKTANAFYGAVGDSGRFAEGMLDLTALQFPSGTCLGDLGTMNVRSHSSLQWTSALQDYMVADVDIDGTCGSMTIQKKGLTGDALIAGAAYSITDDPRPGKTGTYNVFDGTAQQLANLTGSPVLPANTVADGFADGQIVIANADPGSNYVVTELRAPTGYLLPANPVQQPVVVGALGTPTADVTVTFRDPKRFDPLTAKKTATGDYDTSYAWTIDKGVRVTGTANYDQTASKDSGNLSESFDWLVSIGEGAATESNRRVTGDITITNPASNGSAVLATITESLTPCTYYFPAGSNTPLDDASPADGFQVSVPASDAGTAYGYTCTQTDRTATENHVTISVDRSDYPRNQADVGVDGSYDATATAGGLLTAPFSWAEHNTDGTKSIEVTDTLTGATWTHNWGAHALDSTWNATTHKYEHAYSSPVTTTAGHCSSVTNTATITGTPQSAEATASHCAGADLDVLDKTATGTLFRTYPWSIQKSTSTPELNSDVSTTGDYAITVTTGSGDDAQFGMTGTIQVRNPNTWGDGIAVTGLSDVYYTDGTMSTQVAGSSCMVTQVRTGGTDAAPVFSDVTFPYTIPNETTSTFKYSCTFDPAAPDPTYTGTNKATVTWDKAVESTPDGSDFFAYQVKNNDAELAKSLTNDWVKNLVNDTIRVYDDNATPDDGNPANGDETADDRHWDLTWSEVYGNNAGHSLTLDGSSDPSTDVNFDAPAAGSCATHVNTVKIIGDASAVLDADLNAANNSASVEICNPESVSITKDTPTATFDRTYRWELQKFVKDAQGAWSESATYPSDDYLHTFDYEVRAVPVAVDPSTDDSNWVMSGEITLSNPNTDGDIGAVSGKIVEVPNVGGVTAICRGTLVDPKLQTGVPVFGSTLPLAVTIQSGQDPVHVWYQCTFSGKPDYTGSNVVQFQDDDGGVLAQSAAMPVDFTVGAEHDKTLPVFDDKVDQSPAVGLGDANWFDPTSNDENAADYVAFDYPLQLEADHVTTRCTDKVNTAWIGGSDTEQSAIKDSATATICPNAGTWTVSKSVAEAGTVPVGTTLHYTLTAVKTGGVDPMDVDVVDDLTSIAPYVTGAPVVTTGGTDTSYVGGKLTWHIGDLSGTQTLSFEVTVKSDAYSVDLPNLVTSAGSANCPDTAAAAAHQECKTDNGTPPAPVVLPPTQVSPPKAHHPQVLPNTGGPDLLLLAAGLVLLLGGGTMVAGDRLRRRRS